MSNTRYTVTHASYCGMTTPGDSHDTRDDARAQVASILRRRKRQGYPIAVIDKGETWAILEPEGSSLVPDQCGILSLSIDRSRVRECSECGDELYQDGRNTWQCPCCNSEDDNEALEHQEAYA